jgi:hypothetical protein
VTEDIARETRDWSERKGEDLSPGLRDFIDYQSQLSDRSKHVGAE